MRYIALALLLMIPTLAAAAVPQPGSEPDPPAADLIVLQENLFEIPASRIGETRVLMTLFEGRPVFTDPALADEQATALRLPAAVPDGD